MKAIVFESFGGPEVLRLTETAVPEPGPGQVRIRVRASGLNQLDFKIRSGVMQAVFPTTFPAVPGVEVAGVVDAVGPDVTGTAVGDEVIALTDTGGYAEFALATAVAPKPAGLTWEEAAALPVAGETALRVLDLLGVKEGETLLVHGAAGAVGTVAVQLAVAAGATVIGTASPENHDYLRSLGVTPLSYAESLVPAVRATAPHGVDAVFDAAGQGALPASIELRGGTTDRIVTIADPAARDLGVTFSGGSADTAGALAEIARLAGAGALRLTVAETFPLAEAGRAQERSATGHTRGKLVLVL
ncbi:NADPH:quinone reductase [Actinoplanes ianthinogenes]|uniref:NADPH:quinone reductase n=1 Tax=Actinoplanes ianthinogenes TaxID=122358 RepID=A0ABN6CM57_9ACTN|nr:NADP-dependent oxidoreductase [Actinoplanes ianthinogenes]BCJ46140.1 NADPH:quinone reductase [Actinoplanes ianthinogenes]GGR26536.1 NADPH:quinone reductase [Actinoplanes ianthinogenes]